MNDPDERERAVGFIIVLTAGGSLGGLLHWLGLALWQIQVVMAVNAASVVAVVALFRRWMWSRGMQRFRELHPEMFPDENRRDPPA
jgi:hypothetical protein